MKGIDVAKRAAYLHEVAKIIAADGRIDAEEMTRLYEAFAILDATEAERLRVLERLAYDFERLAAEAVSPELLADEELRIALAKDALFLQTSQEDDRTRSAVELLLRQIALTPQQTAVLVDWVTWENRILARLGADDGWMSDSTPKELASRAAAVGLPVTVLYVAGITGFSAAGITSGLAAIGGLTGLTALGLNPMTAGIAGLIVAGVTVKKVADFALGNTTKQVVQLRKQLDELRRVYLRAATRLAADAARFEALAGDAERRAQVTGAMRAGLAVLEQRAG